MRSFEELSNAGKARRLRVVAAAALERYDLRVQRLRLITNEFNAVFRVDAEAGQTFVLRVNLPNRRSLAEIEDAMQAQPGLSSTRMVSGLDTLLDLVDLRVKNLRVPILLVVFQIGAVTLAVLAGVGSLTLTRQTFELAVLHSRGFSRRTLLAAQGAQALLYAAVAFPLGLLLGLGLAKLAGRFNGEQLPGVEFPARLNDGAIWLGLAVALVGALVLLALSQDHRVDRRATPLRPNARSPRSLPVNNGRQAIDLPPVSASRGAFDFRPSFPAGSADRTTSQACRIRPG